MSYAIGIILLLSLLLILYLLFVRIELFLDTASETFYIGLWGLAKASLERHPEEFLEVKLKIWFLVFHFYPLKRRQKPLKKKPKKTKKKKTTTMIKKGIAVLRTFTVKQLVLIADTGNYVLNAQLYPLFAVLNLYGPGRFTINFEGKNSFTLLLHNRPIKIIKSVINF